jgi:hypothetical protein
VSAPIIELVTFRLKPGVDEATFRAAVAKSMPFLLRQRGFLHREVGVSSTGEWTDLVHWADMDAALQAAAAFNDAPETQDFNGMLDRQSVQMRHFRSVFAQRGEWV